MLCTPLRSLALVVYVHLCVGEDRSQEWAVCARIDNVIRARSGATHAHHSDLDDDL